VVPGGLGGGGGGGGTESGWGLRRPGKAVAAWEPQPGVAVTVAAGAGSGTDVPIGTLVSSCGSPRTPLFGDSGVSSAREPGMGPCTMSDTGGVNVVKADHGANFSCHGSPDWILLRLCSLFTSPALQPLTTGCGKRCHCAIPDGPLGQPAKAGPERRDKEGQLQLLQEPYHQQLLDSLGGQPGNSCRALARNQRQHTGSGGCAWRVETTNCSFYFILLYFIYLFIIYFSVWGFELRASHLLGKSTTI
jgi:hypothetical protein